MNKQHSLFSYWGLGRLIAVACFCVVALSLFACGQKAEEKAADSVAQSSTSATSAAQSTSTQEVQPSTADAALAQRLNEDVARIAQESGMDVCVSVVDLSTGTRAGYKGDQKTLSASMIKVLIANTVLQKVQEGAFSLDDTKTLQESDIVGGAGSLQGQAVGTKISYRDLIGHMISESDNTAANMLIDTVGMEAVNERGRALGLTATELGRKMMDTEAQAQGHDNYTCADDLAKLFQMVHEKAFVSPDASALMLSFLEAQQDTEGITPGLPAGTVFAHKTGSLATVRHDGGIVEGERPYILVVLCGGKGFSEGAANNTMQQIARTVNADIVGSTANLGGTSGAVAE